MEPERWRKIDELFHAALECEESRRAAFLVQACAGDDDLRRSVESLLARHREAGEFLESPALKMLARELAEDRAGASSSARGEPGLLGQTVSHYTVLEKLGDGGMGVAYKAKDTQLGRFVALKFVRAELSNDAQALERLKREARSASALNHPNIINIHEIGEQDGQIFIVMELVDGKPLNELIPRKGMRLTEALRIAAQVADALTAAHAAGIVHRDLKPANIMVDTRGRVRVLDFGLAKLTMHAAVSADDATRTLTVDQPVTDAGFILGSVPYMSPEQAEGKPVDARGDIFSFGAVLYEMITGQRAFRGESRAATLAEVVEKDPRPPSEISPATPPELERLIMRCLRKDITRRSQHMSDVKLALEELREDSESGKLARPAEGVARKRPIARVIFAAIGMAALVVGVGLVVSERRAPVRPVDIPVRLTREEGSASYPAISADGKLLAFSSDRGGNFDLYVQQIGGKNPIRITKGPYDAIEPAFTPDGTQIVYYSRQDGGGIYIVPTLGGDPRLLVAKGYRPRVSPDGKLVAYWNARQPPACSDGDQIAVIPIEGGTARKIHPELYEACYPIWSPDGKALLFLATPTVTDKADWWVAPPPGGSAVATAAGPLLSGGANAYSIPEFWRGDRAYGIVLPGDITNLWSVALDPRTNKAHGTATQVTGGTQIERNFSVSQDGTLVFASTQPNEDLYSLPLDAERGKVTGTLRRLTQEVSMETYPTASADGARMSYQSDRSGQLELWVRDMATGKDTALAKLSRGFTATSVISPDGSQVAYTVIADNGKLYVVNAAGGTPRLLCERALAHSWSPDGRSLIIDSYENGKGYEARLDLATGKKTPVAMPEGVKDADPSPDGQWLQFNVERDSGRGDLYVAPLRNPPVPKQEWIPIAQDVAGFQASSWSPRGRFLYWFSNADGRDCLYGRPLDEVTKRPVGPIVVVQHLHLRARIKTFYNVPMLFNTNQFLLPLTESHSTIWMRKLAE